MENKYWWREKKKENSNQTESKAQTNSKYWWREKGAAEAAQNIYDRVNKFLTGHNSYIQGYQDRYADRKGNYEDAYVADSGSYLSSAQKQYDSYKAEADDILSYLGRYEDYLDANWVKSVKDAVGNARYQQSQILDAYNKDNDFWSGYNTAEMIGEYGSAENAYKADQRKYGYSKTYSGKTTSELDNIISNLEDGEEKDWLKSYRSGVDYEEKKVADIGALEKELEKLDWVDEEYTNIVNLYDAVKNRPHEFTEEERNDITDQYYMLTRKWGNPKEFNAMLANKRQYVTLAKRVQESEKLAGVADPNSEFYDPEFSKYTEFAGSTRIDNKWYQPDPRDDSVNLKTGYEDIRYDFINNPSKTMEDIDKTQGEYADKILTALLPYRQMDKSQVATYNYYYAKHGREAANKYLDSIQESLNAKEGTARGQRAIENPFLKYTFFINAGLDQFASGVQGLKNLVKGNEDYVPTTVTKAASEVVREDLKDIDLKYYNFKTGKLEDTDIFGSSLGQSVYDLGTTSVNMVPSILVSTAVGAVSKTAGAVAGNTLMGGSAAGNAYNEVINQGYGKAEAQAYATAVGVSESILQYLLGGIGKLGGLSSKITNAVAGIDNGLLRFSLQYGGKFASEALEEGLQEILDPVFKNAILHADEDINWSEVAYSALLGGLSAGTLEGPDVAINVASEQALKKKYDGKTDSLINEGLQNEVNTESYQLAQQYKVKTDAGKTLTGAEIRQLVEANEAQSKAKVYKDTVSKAKSRFAELGVAENVNELSEIAAKRATGQELTQKEKSKLANSEYGAKVAKELKDEAEGKAVSYKSLEDRVGAETTFKVAKDGQGKAIDPGNVEVTEFVKDKDGNIVDMVLKTDGKEAKASEIDYADNDKAYLFEAVSKIENISPRTATTIIRDYDPSSGQSVSEYLNGIDEAYTYGYHGYNEAYLNAGNFAPKLTETQMKSAYELGKNTRSQNDADADAPIVRMRTAAEAKQTAEQKAAKQKARIESDEAEVYFQDGKDVTKFDKRVGKFDPKRTAAVNTAKFLSKLGIGGKFYFYSSYLNSKGVRVYKDADGNEVEAPNGVYMESDGSIHIDLNAGDKGQGTALFTMGHELAHFVKDHSKKQFKILGDLVTEAFSKTDMSMHERVLAKQKFLQQRRNGEKVSYEAAYEEVVADAMSTMLSDGSFYEMLMEIKVKDKGLFDTIKRFFEKMIAKFTKAYEELDPDQQDARDIREIKDMFDKIQRAFAEALVEASENFQATEAQKNTTEDGGVDGEYEIKLSPRMEEAFKPYAQKINSVVNQSISGKGNIDGKAQVKDIMPTGPKITAMVAASSGNAIDISRRNIALSTSDIWHEYKRHSSVSEETSRGQIAFTKRQFQNAVKCIISPDIVETIFADTNNPTQKQSFAYAKKTSRGNYVVVEAVGGKKNPHIYPVMILQFSKAKWDNMMSQGKTLGEILFENDSKKLNALDIQKNKKSRVTAAQFASYEAIANTLRSPQLDTKVSQPNAIVNRESIEAMDVEVDTNTESVAPKVMKSERTWTESDYVQERDKAAKEIAKSIGVTEKKAKDYIDSINSIAKMIAEDRTRLDYFSSPGRSSFVSNVEYGGSFDFSTLCKKRRLLTGTFTAIQKALPNTALTADEILDIRNRMKEAGLEVSCGLCYVEGSRANMGQFAKEFLRLYKQYYPDAWQPNMADVNTPDGIEWVRINHPEVYEQYEYFWNHYGTLKEGDKNLFASQQKPKLYQLHTEYKGEILEKFNDDENVEEKNINGGIRLQSFSDFEIVHLIDTMQIIMDMSRVGLAGQAYTKVPDFAWALGDTGLKINLSLIAKGVDADGKLIFDDVEGMPIAEAMKLRDRYSKNVGTILVAFNDEQLLAAMADDRVDFIIPFHRSQWKKSQYEAMGLPAKTKDYTYMQNEKFIKPQYHEYRGRMVKDKATNYMPNEYWDFSKSGKENAEAYLEMCARNNKRPKFYKLLQNNGDGSYSLKADGSTDGYWKLLIDFKMYDNDGNGSPQMAVKPEFNMEEANRMLETYKGGHSNFPVAQGIVDGFVKDYKANHKGQKFSDRGTGSERNNAPTFYSQMGKVVEGMKQDKFGASSVISMLRGRGVKAEEIRWSGIQAFLDGKKSVTKQELLDFINGSMLHIEEESRTDNKVRDEFVQAWRNFIDQDLGESEILDGLNSLDEMESYLESLVEDEDLDRYYADYILRLAHDVGNSKDLPTKWSQYKLDGGENYRELLFKLPGSTHTNTAMQAHWGDGAEGVLAHARIQDLNTFLGKMLFVEEIQSDYHNEGHSDGYFNEQTEEMYFEGQKELREQLSSDQRMARYVKKHGVEEIMRFFKGRGKKATGEKVAQDFHNASGFLVKKNGEAEAVAEYYNKFRESQNNRGKVPDAPFKETYHEYVLKRLLRMAAEEGYDSIGWTTADIQSQRWSEDYAEGYRIEYDQDIPKFLKKYGKQWDATVGKTVLDNGTEVWSMDITDSMKKSVLTEGQALYSERGEGTSNRDMLANAFETISKNSEEYKMIQEYKSKVNLLNKLEQDLNEVNQEIRDIHFGEKKYDAERLKLLEGKAKRLANDITKNDRRLLNMEASAPLRRVIQEERKKEAQKTKAHVKEIQQNKKLRAEQTELRHKIRKTIRDLNKILNRGNKKQNVKEDMKGFVSKALELADYLFTDHISNDDLIRKGINPNLMRGNEAQLVKETEDILTQLYDNADSLTDEEFTRLDAKRKANEDKLRELLTKQRNERLNTPVYNLFNDLVTEYASLKNSQQEAVKGAYDPKVEEFLRSYLGETTDGTDSDRKTLLQNMRVADMTTEELWKLHNAYTMVLHSVRKANELFVKGKTESIEQMAGRITSDFSKRKAPNGKVATVIRNLTNKLGWDYEKLYYALDRIGSEAFTELVMNLADAENTVMQDIREAVAFRDEIVKKYDFNNWAVNKEIDKEFLDTTGKKFKLTLGQLMSLYAYSRREGAWDHIEYGGFVFGEAALTNPKPADSYKLSKAQCEAITNTLTKKQKGYVEDMQKFLSETMGAKGNEVSMLLYGINMFGEKNYFPIHIAGQFKSQAQESQAKAAAGFGTMTNAGFTHAQNPNAKAPFVLEGFNEIWADHVNEMSRYHGTVPALEDMRRVMNRSSYSEAESESMAIKQLMENSFGKEAVEYFDNLYREANSGAITDKMQRKSKKLLSLFRKNSVAYSLSVVIQQPSAMARAYAMIDKKYFGFKGVGALTSGVAKAVSSKWNPAYAKAYNEMLKYAPGVTMAKEIGGFDTHTGSSIREYLLDTGKSFKQSVKTENLKGKGKAVMDLVDDNAIANLPTVADKIAWIDIWNACKRETVSKHKDLATNSDEFLQIVGDRFTEVIRATQVYDSIFSKSPMLKSKSLAVQYLVSFMNEPNTTANMVEKAVRDAIKGDWKGGLRTAGAVTYSIIFNNVLKAIVYAMRDDDEDETYIEKYLAAVAGGMMDDFNPISYIPIARDAWSKIRGYDVERPDMAIITDAIDAFKAKAKLKDKDIEDMTDEQIAELDKKMTEANWKLVGSLAAFFGIPVKNIYREIDGVIDQARIASKNAGMTTASGIWDKVKEEVIDSIPFASADSTKSGKLYDAIISGEPDRIKRQKAQYADEKAVESAMREEIKDRFKSGDVDNDTAKKHLINYGGLDKDDAESRVRYWSYIKEHPEYKKYELNESNVNKYLDFAKPAGISMDVFVQYRDKTKGIKSVLDEYGDVEVTAKEQVLDVIDSLPITDKQKDALYLAHGYAESEIWDVPW